MILYPCLVAAVRHYTSVHHGLERCQLSGVQRRLNPCVNHGLPRETRWFVNLPADICVCVPSLSWQMIVDFTGRS